MKSTNSKIALLTSYLGARKLYVNSFPLLASFPKKHSKDAISDLFILKKYFLFESLSNNLKKISRLKSYFILMCNKIRLRFGVEVINVSIILEQSNICKVNSISTYTIG